MRFDTENGNLATEARCYTAGCEDEGKGQDKECKEWGSGSWKRPRNRFPSTASRGSMALLATCFQPSDTVLDFFPPELYETKYVFFKPPNV